jgi:hypothetical protein
MPERFTDSVVAAVRRRYEDTDQLIVSIAAEFGVGERTIGRWISAHGWRKRSLRTRGLPVAVQLLEEARGLAADTCHSRTRVQPLAGLGPGSSGNSASAEALGPRLRGDDSGDRGDAAHLPSPIDRLEALAVNEIAAEEAAQAQRRGKHNAAKASERSARTLSTLTQILHTLQRMRAGLSPEQDISQENVNQENLNDDDMPRDIDEFRRDLARRIDAFVASRTDAAHAGGDAGASPLDEAG